MEWLVWSRPPGCKDREIGLLVSRDLSPAWVLRLLWEYRIRAPNSALRNSGVSDRLPQRGQLSD